MSLLRVTLIGAAVAVFLWPADAVLAQPKFLRRAVSNAVSDNRRPTLLDQMFSPGGSASLNRGAASNFRGFRHRPTAARGLSFQYMSDGSPYDPYQQASLINRYRDTPQPWSQPSGPMTSSNVANVYAPASYQVPGMPSGAPPLTTGVSQPLGTQVGSGSTNYPIGLVQTNIGLQPSSATSLSDALWQVRDLRRSLAVLPTAMEPHSSLSQTTTPPAASRATSQRHIDLALRSGARAFQRGDFERAREDYVQALVLGCDDTRVRIGLGLAEFARGRYDEAATAFQAELIGAPNLDRSGLDLRKAYGRPEEFESHVSSLERTAVADEASQLFVLGYVRMYSGDRVGGAEAWRRYAAHLDADPAVASIIHRLLQK